MALNKGILTADTTEKGDEAYTPFYAVEPIIKYIDRELTVWCPFDQKWSAFVQMLEARGNKVIYSHLENGEDFFKFEPENYDLIVSNPPFSKKDQVLKRLRELDKPFAMLLPLATLQGQKRFDDLEGCQALIFDKRIGFHTKGNMKQTTEQNSAATIYICKEILPKDLIFEKLVKYEKPLVE